MGKRIGLSLALIAIAVSLILPSVRADQTTLNRDELHEETYTLREGDIIKWNWEVVGTGDVDFWIEDSDENRFSRLNNDEQSEDQFTIPESGKWMVVLSNDRDESVTVEYDFDIERVPFLPSWLLWVVLILIVLVIVATVLTTRRPAHPPRYPPQQPPKES